MTTRTHSTIVRLFKLAMLTMVLAASFAFVSCSAPMIPTTMAGGIELELSTGARTLAPSSSVTNITKYEISGIDPDGATIPASIVTGPRYTKTGLAIGSWTFTIKGLNSADHVVAQASLTVAITDGNTSRAIVQLERVAGSGTLDLTVNWVGNASFDAIEGTITPIGGAAVNMAFTNVNGAESARLVQILDAGDYHLDLKCKRNGTVLESIVEAVKIYSGSTSIATVTRMPASLVSNFAYSSASPVMAIDFSSDSLVGSHVVNLSGVTGKSVNIVKINQSTGVVLASSTGAVSSSFHTVPYDSPLEFQTSVIPSAPATGITRYSHTEADAWNAFAPKIVETSGNQSLRNLVGPSSAVNYGDNPALTVGTSTKVFWVQDASDVWVEITATLRALGQHCYIWVPEANYDDASASDTDNKITSAEALALAAKFDGTSGNSWTDGIYRQVSGVFGHEVGGGPSGDGGRDADQHVAILVYDVDGDYASTQTGGVLGFFWGKDDYSQAEIDGFGSTIKTNYAEIFYLDAHFTDLAPNMMYSTLAHEYQHMINYNQKTYVFPTSAANPAWVNEMCSMVAEDLLASPDKLNLSDTEAPYGRLNEFTYHYAESGVTDWLSGNNVLKSYAGAYAFGAYLLRNYGGPALFSSIVQNSAIGEASVTAALAANGYSAETFASVLARYGEALVYTDQPSGSSVKTLKKPYSGTFNGISYSAKALDLAAVQQYNLAAGWVANAFGARVYDVTASPTLQPAGLAVLSKPAWQNLTADTLSLTFTRPSNSSVKLYLMIK